MPGISDSSVADIRRRLAASGIEAVVIGAGEGLVVDVLLAETEYQRTAMDRAVDGVITAEDVIIHKLLAWRPRDRDDIASILGHGHQLDVDYIESWADAWEVRDRWEAAKREI